MSDQKDSWTPGIESILEEIRLNSLMISEYHKERYYHQKGFLKYFRIPTIIFSAMNSVFSVGLQPYCPQPTISIICCMISMVCGIISSIELFLSIQATMENELIASKDFYLLSVDIFKMLYLERETRMVNGKAFLDETYQTYCKLIENTNLVKKNMKNMINLPTGPNIPNNQNQVTIPKMIENISNFNNEENDIENNLINTLTNTLTTNTFTTNTLTTNTFNKEFLIDKALEMIPNFTALESKMEEHLEKFEEKEELKEGELKEELKEELNEELNEDDNNNAVISDTIVKPKRKYTKKSDKTNI